MCRNEEHLALGCLVSFLPFAVELLGDRNILLFSPAFAEGDVCGNKDLLSRTSQNPLLLQTLNRFLWLETVLSPIPPLPSSSLNIHTKYRECKKRETTFSINSEYAWLFLIVHDNYRQDDLRTRLWPSFLPPCCPFLSSSCVPDSLGIWLSLLSGMQCLDAYLLQQMWAKFRH